MSIATEITRLQTAKADLKTAIEGKGVTVPSATKIDGYADLVDAIQTGGGGISADDIATKSYTHISLSVEQIARQWTFAFQNIETIDAPNLKTINGDNNFYACKKLGSIIFPELTSINGNANFAYSGEGTPTTSNCILVFPKLALVGVRATFDRGMFAAIDIGPNTTYLYADTFYHNTGNQTVGICILRRTAGVVAANTTGSINGLRDVYVPSALISDYQAATNWSTRYSGGYITFHAIEGSIYETQYADGTPIPTT